MLFFNDFLKFVKLIFSDFSYTEGPTMQIQRYQHACGTFEQDGKPMVIVMGGYAMAFAQRTSEVLDLTTMQWKTGHHNAPETFKM